MADGGYVAVSPHSSSIVFCVGYVSSSIGVSHTSDGTTWEHDTLRMGAHGYAIAFDPVDSARVYVGGDSASSQPALLITTDCGATWTQSRTGLSGRVYSLAVDPNNNLVVYAGTGSGVFKSTDAGATWAATAHTQQTRSIVIDPNNSDNVFAGTYGYGVSASTDGGTTWNQMNDGLACNKVLMLALRPGAEVTLFAGTEGGSVFRTTVTTGIAGGSPIANRQSSIAISPNPCRDLATISLNSSLLTPHSSLSLYDASGRLVRSLEVRTSSFELRTSSLPPGAYFVRLSTGKEARTARLTIAE